MGLEIRQTYAQIGIDRTPSSLEIRSEKARLELYRRHAKVNIHTELPKVIIDQYECFATAGLKGNLDRTREISQRAYQHVIEYIGKTAEDGRELSAIENGGNPIASIVRRDAWPTHEFGLDFIPKARPKIEVIGDVEIDPERNPEGTSIGVEGNYFPGSLDFNYTPAEIRCYMRQYGSIELDFTGNNVDTYI